MTDKNNSLVIQQLKCTNEALDAARNYIKLLEMQGAGPIAVGLAKAHYREKSKAALGVKV